MVSLWKIFKVQNLNRVGGHPLVEWPTSHTTVRTVRYTAVRLELATQVVTYLNAVSFFFRRGRTTVHSCVVFSFQLIFPQVILCKRLAVFCAVRRAIHFPETSFRSALPVDSLCLPARRLGQQASIRIHLSALSGDSIK